MRSHVLNLLVGALLVLGAAAANAYTVTAKLNATSSTIANGYTDNGDGTVTADLTSGDFIVVDIWVANYVGDTITGAFTSLTYSIYQSNFLGGFADPIGILEGNCAGSGCTPPKLTPAVPVGQKPAWDPNDFGGLDLIQVVGHTNSNTNNSGTDGTGAPGLGDLASQVAFEYIGVGGFDQLDYMICNCPGDAVSSGVTVENYVSLFFNPVPEPGTALLLGLGLMGLGAVRRRE